LLCAPSLIFRSGLGREFAITLVRQTSGIRVRGTTNKNYAGRNIAISTFQPAQNGQPARTVQQNFYSPVSTAGGFFGSGGPRAFQFATGIEF